MDSNSTDLLPAPNRQGLLVPPSLAPGRAQYISDIVQGSAVLGDVAAIFLGLIIASCIYSGYHGQLFWDAPRRFAGIDRTNLVASLSLLAILAGRHVYDRHLHVAHRESVQDALGKSTLIWGACLLFFSLLFKTRPAISPLYVCMAVPCVLAALAGWRRVFHAIISKPFIAPFLLRRVLVVGWTPEAERMMEFLGKDPTHPFAVVGCVHVAASKFSVWRPSSIPVLGDLSELAQDCDLGALIRLHRIDHLVLSHTELDPVRIAALSRLCENELAELTVIPSYFTLFRSGLRVSTVNGVPMIAVSRLPLDSTVNRILKRTVDVVGATVGLVLAAPLLALFGYLVHRESPGPIFYKQRRIGLKGRIFSMVKIRSMRLDAEINGQVGWSTQDDPRRLKIGALMRRLNIDEIPQFWNVLMGEMSLVGPRPERPELTIKFNETIDDYNVRHGVKPGITGLAQVKGLRGDTDLSERIRQDIIYIEHWSLWNDFKFMFQTFFKNKNAF